LFKEVGIDRRDRLDSLEWTICVECLYQFIHIERFDSLERLVLGHIMALTFEGVEYRTIADVKVLYKVSDKSLREWIKKGLIKEPEIVSHGGKVFRHYTDAWCSELQNYLAKKANGHLKG
jgi:hypothetical protein